jgi:hypothetical protein
VEGKERGATEFSIWIEFLCVLGVLYVQRRDSAPEEREHKRQDDAQDDRRRKREVEADGAAPDHEVAGQPADRQTGHDQQPDCCEAEAEEHEQPSH